MQDSIEDYIRISKNAKNEPQNEEAAKIRDILASAQRKLECEAYAMKIVMFFLDGKLRPEIFLKCLKFINEDYYQDVVEERAITKLCGYPLCNKKIPDMPKQKYFISTKVNKVYDISERKNYCSNFCYKASTYVKNQIDSSPLWLRKHAEIEDCQLLPTTAVCSPGEEVDQGIAKEAPELPQFTSVTHFAQMSLEEAGESENTARKTTKSKIKPKILHENQNFLSVIKEDFETEASDSEHSSFKFEGNSDDESTNKCNTSNRKTKIESRLNENQDKDKIDEISKNNVLTKKTTPMNDMAKKNMNEKEKLEYLISKLKIKNEAKVKLIDLPPMKNNIAGTSTTEPKKVQIKTSRKSNNNDSKIYDNVKTFVEEWITLDTFIFIYGENRIKQILDENRMGEYFDKLKITELGTSQQLKYMNICKRLHMLELAEEKFDNAVLGHSLKPLPDFKQLKEEVQELDFKVKSFYKGALFEKQDTNFPTSAVKENENEQGSSTVLPLVDVTAQHALRRKVFLNSINKTFKKILYNVKLEETYVLTLINDLVRSFKLQAHNVVFKPALWTLMAVILLKILSLKEANIGISLDEDESKEYLNLILSKYPGSEYVIEDILNLLKDVDKFVVTYITDKK